MDTIWSDRRQIIALPPYLHRGNKKLKYNRNRGDGCESRCAAHLVRRFPYARTAVRRGADTTSRSGEHDTRWNKAQTQLYTVGLRQGSGALSEPGFSPPALDGGGGAASAPVLVATAPLPVVSEGPRCGAAACDATIL